MTTRNDLDQVYGPGGVLISSTPVVRDITVETNRATIEQQARTALANNRTYLAIAVPTTAQMRAQIDALTRQNQGLIRLALNQLDDTA